LEPGAHTITLGGWNNKKTYRDEISDIYFDEIKIVKLTNIFTADFDADSEGFIYMDDAFGTNSPSYASGNYISESGYSGGGLHIELGGIDDVEIADGISGKWSRDFTVGSSTVVSISLRYRMVFAEEYEPDECGQAIVTIDGYLMGTGPGGYLEELCGTEYLQDTGWRQVSFDVDLEPGIHTITLGGWSNKKTSSTEIIDIYFDDIIMVQQ
jgi:hypothetical protein